mmetsp:Transcript_87915/g.158501  ORF Transcript_87915/g.158501 Transcript_87915/m.158501 type:complete len:253 (-) Transcript_87915:1895-2653(-)
MCVSLAAVSSSFSNPASSASWVIAYSVLPTPGAPRSMISSLGKRGFAATREAYCVIESLRRAPLPSNRFLKIVLASWATHSSRPLFTAVAIEASSKASSSLSSPMVTAGRASLGPYAGGLGTASGLSSFTSALTPSSALMPALGAGPPGARVPRGGGGVAGGRGAEPPPSSCLTPCLGSRSSCLTTPGPLGGRGGGRGASCISSSLISAFIAARSAFGANLRWNTRTKSSWPRRIRTAALASTEPERASTNS